MNQDRAKELLPLIQALAEGKTIQYKSDSTKQWADIVDPGFNQYFEYRVKPEPRTIFQIFADSIHPNSAPHSKGVALVILDDRDYPALTKINEAIKAGEISVI